MNHLRQFQNGSEEAFSKLYLRYRGPILSFVRSRIADPEVASELTQEVFLKAFRFRDTYQERYAFSTWLWTIARNSIADHLRARRGSPFLSDSGARHDMPDELPCPRKNAEALILRKDQRRSFVQMMKRLTRMQKRVLWLRAVHQLSYQEISRRLGLSLPSVKNLAYRAKIALTAQPFGTTGALPV